MRISWIDSKVMRPAATTTSPYRRRSSRQLAVAERDALVGRARDPPDPPRRRSTRRRRPRTRWRRRSGRRCPKMPARSLIARRALTSSLVQDALEALGEPVRGHRAGLPFHARRCSGGYQQEDGWDAGCGYRFSGFRAACPTLNDVPTGGEFGQAAGPFEPLCSTSCTPAPRGACLCSVLMSLSGVRGPRAEERAPRAPWEPSAQPPLVARSAREACPGQTVLPGLAYAALGIRRSGSGGLSPRRRGTPRGPRPSPRRSPIATMRAYGGEPSRISDGEPAGILSGEPAT